MTINDILQSDLSDSQKIEMITILQMGGVTKSAEGGSVKVLRPTETITVGSKEYDVELAETPEEREDGLSRVKSLESDEGMLFIHEEVTSGYYTMAETSIDLDIIFMDEEGTVIKVVTAKAKSEDPVECEGYKYVLEVNPNSGVEEGDELDFEDDEISDEDKAKVQKRMLVLNSDGDVQMRLQGGERIFSRIFTRKLIKAAIRAYKSDDDSDYRRVGRFVLKELDAQDNRDPQYVEKPE